VHSEHSSACQLQAEEWPRACVCKQASNRQAGRQAGSAQLTDPRWCYTGGGRICTAGPSSAARATSAHSVIPCSCWRDPFAARAGLLSIENSSLPLLKPKPRSSALFGRQQVHKQECKTASPPLPLPKPQHDPGEGMCHRQQPSQEGRGPGSKGPCAFTQQCN
jgi:hypothetical protein